jgi:hypothetical protein
MVAWFWFPEAALVGACIAVIAVAVRYASA